MKDGEKIRWDEARDSLIRGYSLLLDDAATFSSYDTLPR